MKDKTPLDFNFFGEKAEEVDTSVSNSNEDNNDFVESKIEVSTSPVERLGFTEYFKYCYLKFSKFSKEYLTKKSPRYLIHIAYIVGVGTAADRFIGSIQDYSDWSEVWAIVLFSGIIAGALVYYIGGWFYNIRIKWSKGHDDINTSRNIYVFSTLPISIATILSLIFNQMAYGEDYFTYYYSDITTVDFIFLLIFIVVFIYSIRISYKAAREVLRAEKGRAIWWFVVAPILFYLFIWVLGAIASA